MLKTTPLSSYHSAHAKLTEFAGYEMPLWYTTTTEEHLAVRNSSGAFDVSHMGRLIAKGPDTGSFLERLVPTRVQQQPEGKAFYTLLLNDHAGIVDDLIIIRLSGDEFMLVVNAANRETDLEHILGRAATGVQIEDMTSSSAMIAFQGPMAQQVLQPMTELDLAGLRRFQSAQTKVLGNRALVSRTGYTGEDGFEIIIFDASNEHPGKALQVWEKLVSTSTPCGLGARDSLRLEAGFPLHGSDIDQETDPFQADLAWVISPDKGEYVGSEVVSALKTTAPSMLRRGIVLEKGIPRHGFEVLAESGPVGTVTSGTFSPVIKKGIALSKVNQEAWEVGARVEVKIRENPEEGRIVKPPFYDQDLYGWKRTQK